MANGFLHNHKDYLDLLRIVSDEQGIDPVLIEKDYWIMHCLYGLQQLGMVFELKGGTSLSKGFGIIDRFSEDIDIRIEPPTDMDVKTGRNQMKPAHVESRKDFYDWLAQTIEIDGVEAIERDNAFDDEKFRSGGIRLNYKTQVGSLAGVKDGVLLEVGFDDITPNFPKTITSWAYEYAREKVDVIDNRAIGVACYHPGFTFVEKLQTISTKFRKQQAEGTFPANFMRHYYDVFQLLQQSEVLEFIGTEEYFTHKARRFRGGDNPVLADNDAFLLSDAETRKLYEEAYISSKSLYYREQPNFEDLMRMLYDALSKNEV